MSGRIAGVLEAHAMLKRLKEAFFTEPVVAAFAECPNCKQLLEFDSRLCPRCREEIDENYAALSAVVVYYNTQACSVANTISSFDSFIPLAIIGTALIHIGEWATSDRPRISFGPLVWPVMPLVMILIWYARFGRIEFGDEEYLKARREMRRSFTFWLTLLVVQALLLAVRM